MKNKANRSKDPVDIANYKNVSLYRQTKPEYLNEVLDSESWRHFWDIFKSYFSSKHVRGDSRNMLIRDGSRAAAASKMECFVIILNGWKPLTVITKHSILDVAAALDPHLLIENNKMSLKREEVAKEFKPYFGYITISLDSYKFPSGKVCERLDGINNIVWKFRNQQSIVKIKERYQVKGIFRLATTEETKAIIRDFPTNKAAWGKIPGNIMESSNFSFDELTICVNHASIKGKFPITLKNTPT